MAGNNFNRGHPGEETMAVKGCEVTLVVAVGRGGE